MTVETLMALMKVLLAAEQVCGLAHRTEQGRSEVPWHLICDLSAALSQVRAKPV